MVYDMSIYINGLFSAVSIFFLAYICTLNAGMQNLLKQSVPAAFYRDYRTYFKSFGMFWSALHLIVKRNWFSTFLKLYSQSLPEGTNFSVRQYMQMYIVSQKFLYLQNNADEGKLHVDISHVQMQVYILLLFLCIQYDFGSKSSFGFTCEPDRRFFLR